MPSREFIDSPGRHWHVWSTVPSRTGRAAVSPRHESGWLSFESGAALRRLAPIPADWEAAPPEQLELLCLGVRAVRRRSAPSTLAAGPAVNAAPPAVPDAPPPPEATP